MSAVDDESCKRRSDDEEVSPPSAKRRAGVRRSTPGGKADSDGRRVPNGFLYHVVGAEEPDGPGGKVRLLVRPGVPTCWMHTNAGFFVGRHVAKTLPDVPQFACALNATKPAARRRAISVKCPTTASYAWPAYEVDFDDVEDSALTLSKFYARLVMFAVAHMPDIAAFLKSGSSDLKLRAELDEASELLLTPFFGKPGAATTLELNGVGSPLLVATHCLILDRDVARDPGPANLVDSIPPVMRHDGMPDTATLERWADQTRQRCQLTAEPVLSWGAATIQFGENQRSKLKGLWDIIGQQVAAATAVNKSSGHSHHDAWIETAFRVASIPFVAFLLKRRNITLPEHQLPLADMPVWSRAFEHPLVALHPLAPRRVFNIAAVLASVIAHTELASTARPQARVCHCRGDNDWLLQDRAICEKLMQVSSILTSAVFCNTPQLNKVCVRARRSDRHLASGAALPADCSARHCESDDALDAGLGVCCGPLHAERSVGPQREQLHRVVRRVGRRDRDATLEDAERRRRAAACGAFCRRSQQSACGREPVGRALPPGRDRQDGEAGRHRGQRPAVPRVRRVRRVTESAVLRVQYGASTGAARAQTPVRTPAAARRIAVYRPASPLCTGAGPRRVAPTGGDGRTGCSKPAGPL